MNYVIFAWLATIFYGFEVFIGKLTSKYGIKNVWAFSFFFSLFTTILTIPVGIIHHVSFPKVWPIMLLIAGFYALTIICYSLSLYALDITVFSPLFNIRIAFVALFGMVLVGEVLSLEQYILISIVIIAGFFVTMDEKLTLRSFFQKKIFIALLCMTFLALWNVYTKIAVATNGYWETNIWTVVIGQLLLCATIPLFKKDLKQIRFKTLIPLSVIAISATIGNLTSAAAFAINGSITSAILSLPISMILTIGYSLIASKPLEKHTVKIYIIRFIATAVMILAALKLST